MSLFQARRKPKRVAREEADQAQDDNEDSGPVVRRPGAVKQKSKLRVSFDPTNEDNNDSSALPSESEPSSVVRPVKRGVPPSLQDRLKQTSIREDEAVRPSYSKIALDELRASTPSTPKDLSLTTTPDPEDNLALSVESKFGKLATTATTSIPSAAEISERKARRARLALEQAALPASTTDPNSEDYIPLDAYDSDGEFKPTRMQVGTWHQPAKEPDSRVVHDDEDMAEGFEEFTEPSGPVLGDSTSSPHHKGTSSSSSAARTRNRLTTDSLNLTNRSARANAAAERSAIRAAIEAAEASHSSNRHNDSDNSASDSDGDDTHSHASSDEAARHHAYELSQTSHALPSTLNTKYMKAHRRPKQPRETTPIVKLSAGLAGLRERVEALGLEKARLKRRLQECGREREAVRERQEFIQRSLEEGARQLEGVLRDPGVPTAGRDGGSGGGGGGGGCDDADNRGETIEDADDDSTTRTNGRRSAGGLGFGRAANATSTGIAPQGERGLENFGSGMGRPPDEY